MLGQTWRERRRRSLKTEEEATVETDKPYKVRENPTFPHVKAGVRRKTKRG